jgi:hypothetical protein
MYGPVRGEHIARPVVLCLNVWDQDGAGTLEGLSYPVAVPMCGQREGPSEDRLILWGTGGSGEQSLGLRSV